MYLIYPDNLDRISEMLNKIWFVWAQDFSLQEVHVLFLLCHLVASVGTVLGLRGSERILSHLFQIVDSGKSNLPVSGKYIS